MSTDTDPRVAAEIAAFQKHYGPSEYANDPLNPRREAFGEGFRAGLAAKVPSAPVEAVPLTRNEHEVMGRALRRSVSIVRPSADEASSRRQFEAFHAGRKNRGAKHRAEMFKQLEDGSYADESEARHWWTWQTAVAFALDVLATTPPQAEPSPSMSKSWQIAVAVAREAPSGRAVVDSAVILAIDKRLTEAFAELQEVRKDAVIHRGGERPSDGWYWMRWHVDGPTPTPWALLNTFAGPMLETTEWAGPLKPPAAAVTKEKP